MIAPKLLPQQLESVLTIVFKGAIFRIIRIIKETGRSRVPWVYLENQYGQRRATFVSIGELNHAFLLYLNKCQRDRQRLPKQERFALSAAMTKILKVGDAVFKFGCNDFGTVVSIEGSVFIDWGNGLPLPEIPMLLELF